MKRLLLMVACVLVMAGPTVAGPITILNPSFEFDGSGNTVADDNLTTTAANWSVSNAGIVNHLDDWQTTNTYAAPYGNTVAWVNSNGSLSQVLTPTLTGNTTYTLKSYVGHHPGYQTMPDYTVQLWAFSDTFAVETGHLLTEIKGKDPGQGNYGLYAATYFAATGNSWLGEKLLVRLWGNEQVNFDLVSLDATAVPLPGGLVLLGSGLLRLVGWRRFRKS